MATLKLRLGWAFVACLALGPVRPAAALQCVGDCALDGRVTVDEVVVGVGIALGSADIETCRPFDRSGDNTVTVDEILAAVNAALNGCTPNRAPQTQALPLYRTHPGEDVGVPLPATDADDDALTFTAVSVPPGAMLDPESGLLSWNPTTADLGTYQIEYEVTDDGIPSLSAEGGFELRVVPLEQCIDAECDPATGCTGMPTPIDIPCCGEPPDERFVEPFEDCPDGIRLVTGRNREGFGPMFNCDILPVSSIGQGGTRVDLRVAARCIQGAGAQIRVQLFTDEYVLANSRRGITLAPADNGFVSGLVTANVDDSTFEPELLEGVEAQLYVSIQDIDGFTAERTQRVRLTLGVTEDLPEVGSPVGPDE